VICWRRNSRLIPFTALFAAAVLPGWTVGSEQNSAAAIRSVLRVHQAVQLCHAHPAARYRLWVDGWFVPAISAYGFMNRLPPQTHRRPSPLLRYRRQPLRLRPRCHPLLTICCADRRTPWPQSTLFMRRGSTSRSTLPPSCTSKFTVTADRRPRTAFPWNCAPYYLARTQGKVDRRAASTRGIFSSDRSCRELIRPCAPGVARRPLMVGGAR